VPASHAGGLVSYPVSRTGKLTPLIASCAAHGSSIKPAVIVAGKTFEDDELATMALISEKVDVYHQAKAFIDRDALEGEFKATFTPDAERRERFSDKGPVFLLLENCTAD
jgi:hypothetical protein